MNDDIVERLRLMCDRFYGFPDVTADLAEAADEIERLRAVCGSMDDPSRTSVFDYMTQNGTPMVRTITYTTWRPA